MVFLRTIYSTDREPLFGSSQVEALCKRRVALELGLAQIGQEPAALADQLEQTTARRLIVFVCTEVLGKLDDPGGQQRNLNLG